MSFDGATSSARRLGIKPNPSAIGGDSISSLNEFQIFKNASGDVYPEVVWPRSKGGFWLPMKTFHLTISLIVIGTSSNLLIA